jgi:hypothetical protein
MKRVIAIWIAVIAAILIIGLISGSVGKNDVVEEPTAPLKDIVVGYDENGNAISEKVPQNEITINIDGQDFAYNSGAFANKNFKIEDKEIPMNFTIDDLVKNGLKQDMATQFSIGESTITTNYNSSTGKGISLNAYTESYINITKYNVPICKNFELPSKVVLGKSTLEDVQRIYGTSVVYPANKNFCTTTKYYMDNTKTTGFIILYFDNDNILCGVDIGCDMRIKN